MAAFRFLLKTDQGEGASLSIELDPGDRLHEPFLVRQRLVEGVAVSVVKAIAFRDSPKGISVPGIVEPGLAENWL